MQRLLLSCSISRRRGAGVDFEIVNSLLIFVGFLLGMVVRGRVVAKVNGTKSQFVQTFSLEAGERVLWEDLKADALPLTTYRAQWSSLSRRHRSAVRVTNLRIISGAKSPFSTKHVVQQVLYPSDRPYPDEANDMTGGFFALLSPYALLGGLTTLTLFAFHGATFLSLRTIGSVAERATALARVLGPLSAVVALAFIAWTTRVRGGAVSVEVGVVMALALLTAVLASRAGRAGLAFTATTATSALVPVWVFCALWPNVLPSTSNAAWSLTVHNASSSHYTLAVMTVVALIFTPIVLAYQAWTYWVFRARVTGELAQGHGYSHGHPQVATTLARAGESARRTLGVQAEIGRDAGVTAVPDAHP